MKDTIERPEMSDLTVEEVLGTATKSSKTKKALDEMKARFSALAFETEQLNIKKKRVEKEIKQHPTIRAYYELKKQIRKNKKMMEQYAAIYQGGLQLAKTLGIKVDKSLLGMIQEGQ